MHGSKKKQISTHSSKYSSDEAEIDKSNLYVKGLWEDCTQVELDDLFRPYGIITKSRVHGDGVGFVRFEKVEDASKAMLGLHGKKSNDNCSQELRISYAKKKKPTPKGVIRNADNEQIEMLVHQNSKNVYIRGLPLKYSTELLEELCSPYGKITCIKSCKNGFAFVRYSVEDDANRAIQCLHGKILDGSDQPLLVKLANSDPFEPRIEFRNNFSNGNSVDKSTPSSKDENSSSSLNTNNSNKKYNNTDGNYYKNNNNASNNINNNSSKNSNNSNNTNNINNNSNGNNNNNNNKNNFSQSLFYNTIGNTYNSNNAIESQVANNNIYNILSNGNNIDLINNSLNDNNLYPPNLYTQKLNNYNDYNVNFLSNSMASCNLTKPFYSTTQVTPTLSLNNNTNSNTSFLPTNDSSSTSPPLETMSTLSNSNAYSNTTQNISQSPNLQISDQYQPSPYNLPSSSLQQNSPSLECITSTLLNNNNNYNNNCNNTVCNNLASNNFCMPNVSINSTISLDENSMSSRNYNMSLMNNNCTPNNNYNYINPATFLTSTTVTNTFPPSLEISNSIPRSINTLLSPSSILSPSSNILYPSTNNSPNALIINQPISWVVPPTNVNGNNIYPNSGNFAAFSYQNN